VAARPLPALPPTSTPPFSRGRSFTPACSSPTTSPSSSTTGTAATSRAGPSRT
jgi:hypothetical protein